MTSVRLGRTELVVGKQSFGCLPIQRITKEEAVALLRRAYDGGINYFDTARAYSDSEEKVGAAFAGMRDKIVISTKTAAVTAEGMWKDLEESLRTLQTDYIDIYQFHNPAFILTSISSTTPPSAPSPAERTACMRPPWRPSARGRSATSPSPTTGCLWLTRPSTPDCTTPFSFPSATSPAPRSWNWWTSAGRRTWASSP